jgi:hypothetical protein
MSVDGFVVGPNGEAELNGCRFNDARWMEAKDRKNVILRYFSDQLIIHF